MNPLRYLEKRIRGWLPKEPMLLSHQRIKMIDNIMRFQLLRLIYGLMLCALLFTPFGVYHSRSEPYIIGSLWGYHLPIGYIGLFLGIVILLYPRLNNVRSFRFSSFMPFIGLLLLLSFILTPRYYFINLLHGTNFSDSQIDIDYPVGNSVVWGLSLLSIALGLVSFLCYRYPRKQALNRKS